MRIYTIKGETQLSKSPQILVVYPTASDSVRPCKHISSKFPCTDDAVEWQGPHALYLSPSEVICSSWCQQLPCWMEFWCLNDVPLAVFPHQKPTSCSSSQPRSSITYIVPGLYCNAIQQNSQQSCAELSKRQRPRRKSWTGLEWGFFFFWFWQRIVTGES